MKNKKLLVLFSASLLFSRGLIAQDSLTHTLFSPHPAPWGIAAASPLFWLPASHPASFMFVTGHPVNLNLPVYVAKHSIFKKPVLAHDFNLDVYPSSRTRLRFMNKMVYATEQKFRFIPTAP